MLVGLVGHPSSGKSTFFRAATLIDVPTASYPFTTIKPNRGMGYLRVECVDKELGVKCNPRVGYCKDGIRFVPIEILDVAGLVPGAHEGKGLGNQFLNDLNMANALINVIDVSGMTNEKGEATTGYDPANDITFLETELDMWYYGILKKGWEKFARRIRSQKAKIESELAIQLSAFNVNENMVVESMDKLGLGSDPTSWDEEQMKGLASELRKKTKPLIIACNKIDVSTGEENFKKLQEKFKDYILIPCSAESELALREAAKKGIIEYSPGESDFKILKEDRLSDKQKKALEFIRENVLKKYGSTGIQEVLDRAVFDLLKMIAIFPGGVHKLGDKEGRILPDVFLLKEGSTALDFANKIHTDLGKHFLYAMDVRTKLKIGKEHVLKNRDIIEIISTAK